MGCFSYGQKLCHIIYKTNSVIVLAMEHLGELPLLYDCYFSPSNSYLCYDSWGQKAFSLEYGKQLSPLFTDDLESLKGGRPRKSENKMVKLLRWGVGAGGCGER